MLLHDEEAPPGRAPASERLGRSLGVALLSVRVKRRRALLDHNH
jgi:hypothetical protein